MLASFLCLLICATFGRADEAVDRVGKKYIGSLREENGSWLFGSANKSIPLDELVYVRFDSLTMPLPKSPLTRTLLLDRRQHLTGTLLSVDTKKIVFATSWGKTLTLDRGKILGIENANENMPIAHDDFESTALPWQTDGKPTTSQEHAFFGKSSLLFEGASQKAERAWQPALRDGAIRLFVYDPADAPRIWSLTIGTLESSPRIVCDAAGYDCVNVKERFGPLKASPGWHLLEVEIKNEHLRVFVDDHCIGQTPMKDAITSVNFAFASPKGGKLWIDEFTVTRRVPSLAPPAPIKDQDSLWLEHGEQIFGSIVSVDVDKIVLEARSGKRTFTWSNVRGILFAESNQSARNLDPEITFRPASGFALDRLHAKLIRWDKDNLVVRHTLLGELSLERSRLDKVRPMVK